MYKLQIQCKVTLRARPKIKQHVLSNLMICFFNVLMCKPYAFGNNPAMQQNSVKIIYKAGDFVQENSHIPKSFSAKIKIKIALDTINAIITTFV